MIILRIVSRLFHEHVVGPRLVVVVVVVVVLLQVGWKVGRWEGQGIGECEGDEALYSEYLVITCLILPISGHRYQIEEICLRGCHRVGCSTSKDRYYDDYDSIEVEQMEVMIPLNEHY